VSQPTSPKLSIPEDYRDLTSDFLTQVVRTCHPRVTVEAFEVIEAKHFGEIMVSTSDRLKMRLTYGPGAPETLPTQVCIKMKRSRDAVLGELYANETAFYVRLRSSLDIEAPAVVGGICDSQSALYYLLLEDLSLRGATFPNALSQNSLRDVQAVLDEFAKLHAKFWDSPQLHSNLSWYQSHITGPLSEQLYNHVPVAIQENLDTYEFFRDIFGQLNASLLRMRDGYRALQEHQARLPQTILHGDGHIGNSYLLPTGQAGLLDFQLSVKGAWIHDASYLIVTGLPVEGRRQHERELLAYYLDRLEANGVSNPPTLEEAWEEYRKAIYWTLYLGWLPTDAVNYGETLTKENLKRTSTAFADHDSGGRVFSLLD